MTSQLNVPRFIKEAQRLASNGDFQPALRRIKHSVTLALTMEEPPGFRVHPLYHLSIQHPTDWSVYHEWVLPIFVTGLGEPVSTHDVSLSWKYGKTERPGIVHHFFWRVVDVRL